MKHVNICCDNRGAYIGLLSAGAGKAFARNAGGSGSGLQSTPNNVSPKF